MDNFGNQHSVPDIENSNRHSEVQNTFKRKYVNNWMFSCPRRYVLALMLFILVLIQTWMHLNIEFTLAHITILGEEAAKSRYTSIGHWTIIELGNFQTGATAAKVLVQVLGALLIFVFSSHKFLLISVPLYSILHMLTPVALNHHSISLLFVLISQTIVEAPSNVAVIAIWKNWAPPAERTKLILFSLCGIFIDSAVTTFYSYLFPYVTTDASYYLSGIAAIIWVMFWYNITSNTPQNDPLISEEELSYIENNLPSDHLQKAKVKNIPWKTILLSKPVLVLCLIFFKAGCSLEIITISGIIYQFHLINTHNPFYFFIIFLTSFAALILLTTIIADWLIIKFSGRNLFIRKCFLCGGFILQCVFLIGTLAESDLTKTIFYMIGYSVFAVSIPGFITIPLDISSRFVSIISGIVFTFWYLGHLFIAYFVTETINLFHLHSVSWLFLFDGGVSLLSVIVFGMWGDTEEQLWSLTLPRNRNTNDYRSYPKPEDQDNLNLVA